MQDSWTIIPVDGGQISWFLQRGIIQHIQTHDRSYRSTDNILLMSVEFGMANQFIIDLSTNTRRGLNEKVKNGEYPSRAPVGYFNDRRYKTIVVDKKIAKAVREAFEYYANGDTRLEDVAKFLAERGIHTRSGKTISRDRVTYILTNTFYFGLFRYDGELHEGKHTPIISKQLFDKVQKVLNERGKPPKNPKGEPKVFCGLIRCDECGCAITGEVKIKHQKNGNVHRYAYYRCTKKRGTCSQPCVKEDDLTGQLPDILKEFILPADCATELLKMAEKDEKEALQSSGTESQAIKAEIAAISNKLRVLLDALLEQDIDREVYRAEKRKLVLQKRDLEEKMASLNKGVVAWLEPLQNWIKDAVLLDETVKTGDLSSKKSSLRKICGSNLFLKTGKLKFVPIKPYVELRFALKKIPKKEACMISERVTGIGPVSPPWQGGIIPVYDTRKIQLKMKS